MVPLLQVVDDLVLRRRTRGERKGFGRGGSFKDTSGCGRGTLEEEEWVTGYAFAQGAEAVSSELAEELKIQGRLVQLPEAKSVWFNFLYAEFS